MGLIKTAIMTGGAVYAVNKLAKSHQSQQTYQQGPPPQQRGSPQGTRGGDDQYASSQNQQFSAPPQGENAQYYSGR
jgi:hypothetical protein